MLSSIRGRPLSRRRVPRPLVPLITQLLDTWFDKIVRMQTIFVEKFQTVVRSVLPVVEDPSPGLTIRRWRGWRRFLWFWEVAKMPLVAIVSGLLLILSVDAAVAVSTSE